MKIIKRSHIDLIVVSTQFQLMNSIELSINHLRSEHIGLIVLHQNVKHKTQIYELAQKYNLEILYSVKAKFLIQYIDLFFKILNITIRYKINNLIVGHIKNNMMLFLINNLKFNNLFTVDDGDIFEIKDLRPSIKSKFLPINFFSIFDLNSNKYFNFSKNEYIFFKKYRMQNSNNVLFLGATFVNQNLLSQKEYLNFLLKVIEKEGEIDYFPHPRENDNIFKDIKGLNLIKSNFGIEHFLLDKKKLPKKIICFYSTSIVSLSVLFKEIKINIFWIDSRNLFQQRPYHFKKEINYINKKLKINKYNIS